MAYNIINKAGKYNIGLQEWNRKDTADKTLNAFKPNFLTSHQELKRIAEENVVGAIFQSKNIVAQVVEGISNVLHPTDEDNDYDIIQMVNSTIHSTQMLPQLMQKMQKMQTLMAKMQTQLNITNKNVGDYNNTSGGNNINKVPLWRKLYWWIRDACNNQGSCCRAKVEGHK